MDDKNHDEYNHYEINIPNDGIKEIRIGEQYEIIHVDFEKGIIKIRKKST